MCSGYESTGIANSGITTIGWEAIGEGWVNTLTDEELGHGKGGTEEVTRTRVIWCHFGAGTSVDSMAFIIFSVTGEESNPSTGTFTGEVLED